MALSERGLEVLRAGTVIPAHPLALTASRKLDARRQRALSRYYIDAGAGGLAVGVHTTQFAIREAGLYEDVLRIAADVARTWTSRPLALVAGLCGEHRAGAAGSPPRAGARLSRRAAQPRRHEACGPGCDHRALRGDRA